ncbi:Tn5468, transposase protein B [Denitrovibrio acetiphilus DSM 12809]|uniref:Tn5468, transposase protein B n=1 Tax=Denitrovibrio acetiphilus (strain DSM 12809 / NBRC 114555 / N2460) TaxID=522772 RepID=D4H2J3_DENA2|nr:DDE-type integrase/transposase/recombinase [Denitrovibrio acetiphilus]ADD67054.1 Tn5468, transposase protein B [Denitrovibrio acetiphilus DSM 12809]
MIAVNQVLISDTGDTIRILWIEEDYSKAFVIDIDGNSFPVMMMMPEIEEYKPITDQYSALVEGEFTEKAESIRDKRWEIIKDLVNKVPDIFNRSLRGKLVAGVVSKKVSSEKYIYAYLKQYWQRGMTKNALVPDYHNCGTGNRSADAKLPGRKPKNANRIQSIKITPEIMKIFMTVFRERNKDADKISLQKAYENMRNEYFADEIRKTEGTQYIPSYRQFVRRYNEEFGLEAQLRAVKGDKAYEKDHRPILGNSTQEAYGPGSKYQIDATVGDVYLVSEFNRKKIIGRPVIYFCVDVFSRMVAGMYIGLEGPSMAGASMAIINCGEDKVEFCKKYGVEIEKEDWPVENLPATFLGDNGEMKGITPENMIRNFGIKVQTTGTYRADAKGIVERFFRTINEKVKPELPGFVMPDHRQRGGEDYRLDAKMNLNEFIAYLIPKIILHNRTIINRYPFDDQLAKADIMFKPKDLWSWGIKKRAGLLREVDLEQLKASLLFHKKALVTESGIRHHEDLFYTFPIAMQEGWFVRKEGKKSVKVDLAYNPRNPREAYVFYKKKYHRAYPTMDSDILKYNLEDYVFYQECLEHQKAMDESNALLDSLNAHEQSKKILSEAKAKADKVIHTESKTKRTKEIRSNRALEKTFQRQKENDVASESNQAEVISINRKEPDSSKKAMADKLRKLRNKKFNRGD